MVDAGDDESHIFPAASTRDKLEVKEMGKAGADIVSNGTWGIRW